jgi:2-isopropylmalate synthase
MIADTISHLKSQGREVLYDAEHFRRLPCKRRVRVDTLNSALKAGAETLILCDTNGGTLSEQVKEVVGIVRSRFPHARLGIHAHNDSELAVANTLAAVEAGVTHVQGTFNGYGERCGNANLCSIIPNLELKMDRRCLPDGKLKLLTHTSRYINEVANLVPNDRAALSVCRTW